MATYKTDVILAIFDARWDNSSGTLSAPIVTLSDVSQGIRNYNLTTGSSHSDRNPANFFKDFVRKNKSANENWPNSVFSRGYTERQITGSGACFEFVPLISGQTIPFPSIPAPSASTPRHQIESASLPLASRRLGRSDEPWLIQVLVRLRVIETHLALFSVREILQVDHLQMSVKLAKSEIDALFLATEKDDSGTGNEILICCEAKGRGDDILADQIVRQVQALFDASGMDQNMIIPIAVKAVGPSQVHVIEFEAVSREDSKSVTLLKPVSQAVYELVPVVPGIGI